MVNIRIVDIRVGPNAMFFSAGFTLTLYKFLLDFIIEDFAHLKLITAMHNNLGK